MHSIPESYLIIPTFLNVAYPPSFSYVFTCYSCFNVALFHHRKLQESNHFFRCWCPPDEKSWIHYWMATVHITIRFWEWLLCTLQYGSGNLLVWIHTSSYHLCYNIFQNNFDQNFGTCFSCIFFKEIHADILIYRILTHACTSWDLGSFDFLLRILLHQTKLYHDWLNYTIWQN